MQALLLAVLVCLAAHGALGSLSHRRALEAAINERGTQPTVAKAVSNSTQEHFIDLGNSTSMVNRISTILKDLPTIKNVVIFVCGFSTLIILCLLVKIFRSGKRIRKTRKYDIITTPAERVEMAPLNDENYEEEDATVFDVKYRYSR
ncbi:membrane protein FAM174B [Bombina bombina]|uniref:membrane protein FAM174B n=1 Tax=Bombina bombina TaxID=8345 RepID=UPI00235B2911|nr:membrane protein FAM174B [Bombina bombina]